MTFLQRIASGLTGLVGATGVALDAFASHASDHLLSAPHRLEIKPVITLHIIHSCVALILALSPIRRFQVLSIILIGGILIFTVPIYLHALGYLNRAWGAPIGGSVIVLSWLCVFGNAVYPPRKA